MAQTIGSIDLASLKNLRDDVTQYFWFESNSSSAWGSGAHVTLYPESQFTNPNHANYLKGQNIIMNTDGFSIRNGALPMMVLDNDSLDFNAVNTTQGKYTTMATFGLTGAQIGQSGGAHIQISSSGLDVNLNSSTNIANFGINGARIGKVGGAHSVIDTNGQRFYGGSDGTTQLANIGYGETSGESGTTNSPFYTFGIRGGSTASDYDPTATYSVGALSIYDGVLYICVEEIATPEAWDSTKWARAVGSRSLGEGYNVVASGMESHAEGRNTRAMAQYSHAEGQGCKTVITYDAQGLHVGTSSHAEGYGTTASGMASHAEGYGAEANAWYTHAEGYETQAVTQYAHAEGMRCVARGQASHAQNYHTQTSTESQTAIGKYNDNKSANLFEVGNGTADDARSNALEVGRNGDLTASGALRASTETPTISITASSGTLNATAIRRFGNVVQLQISVRNTSATASGGNIFEGTIDTTGLRPLMVTTGASYYGSYTIGATISTAGTIVVRNLDSRSLSAVTSNINISFTYIVA